MIRRKVLALVLAAGVSGCSALPSPADAVDKPCPGQIVDLASHNRFVDHPSRAVSGPARVGEALGTIVGVPFMIVALPVTLPLGIHAWSEDPSVDHLSMIGNAVAFPDAACAVGGAYALGSLPHAIVGEAPRSATSARR